MVSAKEIRNKIKSIKSTQKITHAMQMVATSKMRKTQDRMYASRPYTQCVKEIIAHITKGRLKYEHPYLNARPINRVGFIVISTDRGLCGGLNLNLFKETLKEIQVWNKKNIGIDICTIGQKAKVFFKKHKIVASIDHLGDTPKVKAISGIIKTMVDAYDNQTIDKLILIYNEFINTMTQKPKIETLLPIVDPHPSIRQKYWDYIYEPAPEALLNTLLYRYVESLVYQGLVENIASAQAARMVAMKNATDNAAEFIEKLQLLYNKERQAAITKELSEIVAGAAAV